MAHETEITGVGGIGGTFGVVTIETVARNVGKAGDAIFKQGFVSSLQGGMVVGMKLLFGWGDPIIGETPVFDEDDGCLGFG